MSLIIRTRIKNYVPDRLDQTNQLKHLGRPVHSGALNEFILHKYPVKFKCNSKNVKQLFIYLSYSSVTLSMWLGKVAYCTVFYVLFSHVLLWSGGRHSVLELRRFVFEIWRCHPMSNSRERPPL